MHGILEEFAVVDCETTGLAPGKHHRIIELAIAQVDDAGSPIESWCTLLQVDRDLGPTGVHGIRGRDLRAAPRFEDVLGEVLDRLAGKTVVAHNARFDCTFLEAELERSGVVVRPLSHLCTMELAGRLGIGGNRLRLADCVSSLGFKQSLPHSAENDALACAEILAAFIGAHGFEGLGAFRRGQPRPRAEWPSDDRRAPCTKRNATPEDASQPDFLSALVHSADAPTRGDATMVAPYLEVLDRAIEDRMLSPEEQDELGATAHLLGLSAGRVSALHSDYLATLVALARRDHVVTDRERHDLVLVGEALGIDGVESLLDTPVPVARAAETPSLLGRSVCFTGALTCSYNERPVTRELAHELAEQAGLVVAPRVTKKLDMLVVADPNSLSGKAKTARGYGVRIVAEAAFWAMIGVEVS